MTEEFRLLTKTIEEKKRMGITSIPIAPGRVSEDALNQAREAGYNVEILKSGLIIVDFKSLMENDLQSKNT